MKACSKLIIKKLKNRGNAVSACKLSPPDRSVFNMNRQIDYCNDNTLVQSLQTSQDDMAEQL